MYICFISRIKTVYCFTVTGGVDGFGIPYNSRESPYLRKRFFTCPFILPKDSENIDGLKFFAPPLRTRLKFFAPPFATRPKFFAPLLPKI